MAFFAEKKRLKRWLRPAEEILASDMLYGVQELPNQSRPPVLAVTDECVYLILSGRDKGVIQIPFEDLAGVGRKMFTLLGPELQLILHAGDEITTLTCVYRGGSALTGDLITKRFFGHVVKDTTVEFADSGKNELRAPARWDTGPWDSSEQCEGTVTARETGLYSLANSGTSAEIPWSQLEGFGVGQDGSVVVKAGEPWFWAFALRPDAPDEWKALLEANGVLFGRDLRETEKP